MSVTVVEHGVSQLADYASVPIAFTVSEYFGDAALAALLHGEPAHPTPQGNPYRKDYDVAPGNHPTEWPNEFDVARWIFFAAHQDEERVGGAVLIRDDPAIDLLSDCPACGLLWDIRVAPTMRARGVGSALIGAVQRAAVDRGLHALRVETQQVNVPACRFYERHGFRLERTTANVYEDFPGEIQLVWRKAL
jgi:Acetyltransferases